MQVVQVVPVSIVIAVDGFKVVPGGVVPEALVVTESVVPGVHIVPERVPGPIKLAVGGIKITLERVMPDALVVAGSVVPGTINVGVDSIEVDP